MALTIHPLPRLFPKEKPGMLTKDGMSVEPWDHPIEKTSLVSERTRIEAHFPVTALPSTTSLATGSSSSQTSESLSALRQPPTWF